MNLKDSVANFFDGDSSEYLEHKYAADHASYMFLRRDKARELIVRHLVPKFNEQFHFLDSGCGPGILLQVLDSYHINYWGIDISLEMLKLASRTVAPGSSALVQRQFLNSDVERVPFPADSFDAATSLGVIEYLDNDDRLLAEMGRVIRPGGYLLIAITNRYSYNLLFEKALRWLRKNKLSANVLNYVKLKLKMGRFKQMEFVMRRHRPEEFLQALEKHNFGIVDKRYWGFNFLPHPLNYLCGKRLNRFSNASYEKIQNRVIKKLGEGCMVLCQNKKLAVANSQSEKRPIDRR